MCMYIVIFSIQTLKAMGEHNEANIFLKPNVKSMIQGPNSIGTYKINMCSKPKLRQNFILSQQQPQGLFVTEEIPITVSQWAPDSQASIIISPAQNFGLPIFDLETYTVITHQQIPLLLTKSALSCWMHPTAQITLSQTPSHPSHGFPQIDSKLIADIGLL